ncbi:hypothetical protein [Massilia horti]|uniref:PH domain-containing protein n=1 Tax=Massilia horti TaxID=2562153 RepID=A0A4Y9SNI2_9BURK|nr:hypothetical protein [Massilia horti]TFW28272.1 hypothetical protein E4O92_21725 [Massilia horti]
MEEEIALTRSADAQVIGVKSWVAYAGVAALAAVLLGLALLAFLWNHLAAIAVLAVSVLLVGYRFMLVRSVQLYVDDVGVWAYSGVLPWAKGVQGVKWRDMDEATFVNGFWSWATRSYTIRVGHRFTKDSEILLTDIANGKDAVATLNTKLKDLIRAGMIN